MVVSTFQCVCVFFSFLICCVSAGQLRDDFNARCKSFLVAAADPSIGNSTWADLARLALGTGPVKGDGIRSAMADMATRTDCSDFYVTGIIRMLWMYRNSTLWPEGLVQEMQDAVLQWQYWIDEANGFQGNMMFWTENHQMDFHTSEYLAGLLFKNATFEGTNMTGEQHHLKGKSFVYDWMHRRYLWGFQEWKSETYLQFDVISLVNLASLSPEIEISRRAAMVLDLLLYDLTVHAHKGMLVSSRGRSYGANKMNIANQGVATVIQLLSGGDGYHRPADGPGVCLCVSSLLGLYTVPEALLAIAADSPPELESIEHIGIDATNRLAAAETGLGLSTPNDGMVWWGMQAYAHPLTINLAFTMGDAWDLYHSNETIFKYYALLRPLANTTELLAACEALWPATFSVLGPITSYMYRTPEVSLASARGYRAGLIGFQQHAWQASGNGSVLVFTTQRGPLADPTVFLSAVWRLAVSFRDHRGDLSVAEREGLAVQALQEALADATPRHVMNADMNTDTYADDYADGYWTGSASMPRVGQYKDTLIALYNAPFNGEPQAVFPPHTHAYFPKAHFDEVVDRLSDLNWIIGRQADAYIALHSSSSNNTWQNQGQFKDVELIANGSRAVWVCVVGRAAVHGTFGNFTAMILTTTVSATLDNTMAVTVQFPSNRSLSFGWGTAPLVLTEGGASREIPLDSQQRFESPYVQASFPARTSLLFAFANKSLLMDFNKNTRVLVDSPLDDPSLSSPSQSLDSLVGVPSAPDALKSAAGFTNTPKQVLSTVPNASAVAERAARHCLTVWQDAAAYPHFSAWGYEGGVIQLGLWELSAQLPASAATIQQQCSAMLDGFLAGPHGLAYRILTDERILFPWGYSIGDHIALYPVAYAARVRYSHNASYGNQSDISLCNIVAKRFVLGFPHRLADGTVSRSVGWGHDYFPANSSAVWVDDSFMGTALLAHSLAVLDNAGLYASYAASQLLLFVLHLQDPTTHLLHHGYDGALDVRSCCAWGRGNGWALMAMTDLLLFLPADHPMRAALLGNYTQLALAVASYQNKTDGRWHNVLTDPSSVLETSCSSFFLNAFIRGLQHGWLTAPAFADVMARAWQGISAQVASDGSINDIVGETGIKASAQGYQPHSMQYSHAAPGVGAVLRALAAAIDFGF